MNEQSILEQALTLTGDERARYLDRTCVDQPELRARLETRLAG